MFEFVDKNLPWAIEEKRREAGMRQYGAQALRGATETVINWVGVLSRCDAVRFDAKAMRADVLPRIPTIYRESAAAQLYDSKTCAIDLPDALTDLRSLAERLPG